jgi:HAD superfamily hydrolase (TIGR01458 family)
MQAILFDIDGVLFNDSGAVHGAADTVRWARREGISHLFISNTVSVSRAELLRRLQTLDPSVTGEQLLTPAMALRRWLADQPAMHLALFVPPTAQAELQDVASYREEECRGVVIGDLGPNWSYFHLNHAFRILMQRPGQMLLALGMTRYYDTDSGLHLDAGPFVKALEYASGQSAMVFGKPASGFFQQALTQLEASASDTLMVGDDLMTDVMAAQNCGLQGALVRTGKYRPQDEQGSLKPHFVLDSIADLPAFWRKQHAA